MLQRLDGPSRQSQITADTITPKKLQRDVDTLPERAVITVQSLDGKIWIYFADDNETPTAGDVSSKGFLHYTKGKESYEAGHLQIVYVLAVTGTVDIRGAERA
jgi:hypothetical protein